MFKKVLIAEDEEMMSLSVCSMLKSLEIDLKDTDYVSHCDVALSRIKKALRDGEPYELLLTDLSFAEDEFHKPEIDNGKALIKAVKEVQGDIKVLVFSAENKVAEAKRLMADLCIDAYVPKGRGDAQDLKHALTEVYQDKKYLSAKLKPEEKHHDFDALDKTIIRLLLDGKSQKQIPDYLEALKLGSSSLSTVEKRLKTMRDAFDFNNNGQLIAYCKERNII